MAIKVVGLDGDDTLWHNETRFVLTQTAFNDLLRRHVPEADVEGHLAEVEMKNLGMYGYGVKAFTLSMIESAIQLTGGRIPASDLEVILGWGKRMLTEPTELLDGVRETLLEVSRVYSLLLMLLPAVGLAALYAYNTDFHTYTLDATLVIAVTYLFSAIAVVILPLRKPELWFASPASKVKLLGVPIVPVAGVITIALLVYCLIEWLSNDLYFVNNASSLVYMGANYALAIVIFVGARIIRNRQGIDLSLINKEIPVE